MALDIFPKITSDLVFVARLPSDVSLSSLSGLLARIADTSEKLPIFMILSYLRGFSCGVPNAVARASVNIYMMLIIALYKVLETFIKLTFLLNSSTRGLR